MTAFTAKITAEEVAKTFAKEIQEKSVLITGVTQGSLGFEVALQLSHHCPSVLILAGRNLPKLQATEKALKTASPEKQVRKASEEVNAYVEPIDRLINNAAIMAVPYSKSVDGLELQFATNHIGHFLFTNLIMPTLLAAEKGARVINDGAVYDKWKAYTQTKIANMVFSVALAEKLASKGILSYSLDPGRIKTGLAQSIPKEELRAIGLLDKHGNIVADPSSDWKTLPEGAAMTIVAAFDPSISHQSGSFLVDGVVDNSAAVPYALEKGNAAKLWTLSEGIVGQSFEY